MKYIHVFALALVGLVLIGCSFKEDVLQPIAIFFGATTPEGEISPATSIFGTLGPLLPGGLGMLFLGASKMAHTALKTKKAYIESTNMAIEDGSLSAATTEDQIKEALNKAQSRHHESKLLEKAFDKFKYGGLAKKVLGAIFDKKT